MRKTACLLAVPALFLALFTPYFALQGASNPDSASIATPGVSGSPDPLDKVIGEDVRQNVQNAMNNVENQAEQAAKQASESFMKALGAKIANTAKAVFIATMQDIKTGIIKVVEEIKNIFKEQK